MIVSPHPQRSIQWFQERLGLPTASMFKEIVTTKGNPTKDTRRQKYMDELAGEILSGRNTKRFANKSMRDKADREPDARNLYAYAKNCEVEEVGICYLNEQKIYGASPDGLVNDDGGFETKDADPCVQIVRWRTNWTGMEHFQQVQGCLHVCEREWWDLQSYCEGMESIIIRFYRDEAFIAKLQAELNAFCMGLAMMVKQIKEGQNE